MFQIKCLKLADSNSDEIGITHNLFTSLYIIHIKLLTLSVWQMYRLRLEYRS